MRPALEVLHVAVDFGSDDSPRNAPVGQMAAALRLAAPVPSTPSTTSPVARMLPSGDGDLDGHGFFIGLAVAVPAGILAYAAAIAWLIW